MSDPLNREELDKLFDKADEWPNTFNLAALGAYVLSHPELVQIKV
jgi:hypothetical protein